MNFRFIKQTVLILLLLPAVVLASEVDLSLEVTSPQGEQTIGTTVPFYFQITNNSENTATNVLFENDFSNYRNLSGSAGTIYNAPDLTFSSANSSNGNCILNESIITCTIDNIAPSDIVDITIEMQIEYVGELNMTANISSNQTDINEANNTSKAKVDVSKNNVDSYAELVSYNYDLDMHSSIGSSWPTISANGQIISFGSRNLTPEASGNYSNNFTFDRKTQKVELSSISSTGVPGNGASGMTKISNDGDLIVFPSKADNLVINDNNQLTDLFAHRRSTGETFRIFSSSSHGDTLNSLGSYGIFADDRYVVYISSTRTIVADLYYYNDDIVVYDIQSRESSIIDLSHNDFINDYRIGEITVSANQDYIAFTARPNMDSNYSYYLYLWNKQTGAIKKINPMLIPNGSTIKSCGQPTISNNAKYIAYVARTKPGNLWSKESPLLRYNIDTEETKVISEGINQQKENGQSYFPSISADGRFVTFTSTSSNLIENDTNDYTDIFVHDADSNSIKLVSKGFGGFQAKRDSAGPEISANGTAITYMSAAHNLVLNDTNDLNSILVSENPFLTQPAKQVDLSIEKTASASEIEIGKNITYTLTVDNISVDPEATATEVSIEDVLPTGLTFDSITHPDNVTCSENSGTVSCDLGDIAVGDPSVSIEIIAKTTAKGEIKNTATVSAAEDDSDTSNNSSEATIDVIELTDIYIEGSIASPTDPATEYYIEEELTYNFVVGNNSAITATDVTAIITLPTTFSSITASTDVDNSTCAVAGKKITCIFGDDIENTDKANITVKATPSAAGNLKVEYEVTISETQTDSNTDNNSDEVEVIVEPKSDLAISIEDSDDPDGFIYAGTNLTYTITVKNNGPSDATNVKIKDTLPTGVTFVSAIITSGASDPSDGCSEAAEIITCDIASLAIDSDPVVINVVINPTTQGTITNKVEVFAYEHDHVNTNNIKTEDALVKAVADLQITSVSASPIPPSLVLTGNELTYTFNIKNNGINDATEVELKDTLPDGMEFVSAGSSPDCTEAAGEVTCNIGDLANGADINIYIVVKPTKPGIFTNEATVKAAEHDDNKGNNKKDIDVEVKAVTDMELVSASVSTLPPIYAGANLTYDVTIKNNAAEFNTAKSVKVIYTFDGDIVLDSASSCTAMDNVVTCNVDDMIYGTNKDLKLIIQPDMDGDLEVDIVVSSTTHDPDTSNNTIEPVLSTTVTPAVDIVVTMLESTDPILVGQDLTYTITITNDGPSTATRVVLTDTLPGAAPVQSFVTSQGTCINNLTTLVCTLGDLVGDASVQIKLILRPTNGAAGTLTNVATVSNDVHEEPTTPDNNVATVLTTVNQSSKVKVSLKGKGSGTVDIDFNGTVTTCPGDCERTFTRGDTVTLTAIADPGSTFNGWQGGVCSGKNNICEFTLDKPNMNVMASFKKL